MLFALMRDPRERNGYPLQYSFLENSMDRGAWWAIVHGLTKIQTQLGTQHAHCVLDIILATEKTKSGECNPCL